MDGLYLLYFCLMIYCGLECERVVKMELLIYMEYFFFGGVRILILIVWGVKFLILFCKWLVRFGIIEVLLDNIMFV